MPSVSTIDVAPLLDPYRECSSNYGDPAVPLSDHLPMTVAALGALGASEARIAAWARAYALRVKLRPADPGERAGRRAWRARIAREGARATLNVAARTLARGMGAAAFHAVIRAGYAVERGDDDELAAAFESWEREFLPLPVPLRTRTVPAAEALEVLARADVTIPAHDLIATAMHAVGETGALASIAAVVPPLAALDDLALAAAAAFARSRNFTALHVMTGTYAMRVLAPLLDEPDAVMAAFWCAFAAAAIVAGARPSLASGVLDEARAGAPASWGPLIAAAIAHGDEHVIKAAYTAWRLDDAIGDPLFRAAAARYIEKLTGPSDCETPRLDG